MSVKLMGQVWELDLPHNKLLVLLAMADHADHEGKHVRPSVKLIAWKTGYEERQVRRIIATLERDRLLVAMKRGGGRHRPTEYTICVGNGVKKSPFRQNEDILTGNSTEHGHFDRESPVKMDILTGNATQKEDILSVFTETNVDILTGNAQETWTSETQNPDIAMSTEPSLEPKEENKETETTSLSSSGTGSVASFPDRAVEREAELPDPVAPKKSRRPKDITPIPQDHWLSGLLEEYREEFDSEVLNDWHWWERFVKTFPEGQFTKNFVAAAFADLVLWFERAPAKRPRNKKGWQGRIHYSLNRFYNQTYVHRVTSRSGSPQSRTVTQTAIANFVQGGTHDQ